MLLPNKDNWFYSLKKHRVSVHSGNLLKCVAQSDFQCLRCKTFLEPKLTSTVEGKYHLIFHKIQH